MDDDQILLMIDNCQQAHSAAILHVKDCMLSKWKSRAKAMRTFVCTRIEGIMRNGLHLYAGEPDFSSAVCLRQAIRDLIRDERDTPEYWRGIDDHYRQKLKECGVPQKCSMRIAEHQRKMEDAELRRQRSRHELTTMLAAANSLAVYGHMMRVT